MKNTTTRTVWAVGEAASFAAPVAHSIDEGAAKDLCRALNEARGVVGFYQVSIAIVVNGRAI